MPEHTDMTNEPSSQAVVGRSRRTGCRVVGMCEGAAVTSHRDTGIPACGDPARGRSPVRGRRTLLPGDLGREGVHPGLRADTPAQSRLVSAAATGLGQSCRIVRVHGHSGHYWLPHPFRRHRHHRKRRSKSADRRDSSGARDRGCPNDHGSICDRHAETRRVRWPHVSGPSRCQIGVLSTALTRVKVELGSRRGDRPAAALDVRSQAGLVRRLNDSQSYRH